MRLLPSLWSLDVPLVLWDSDAQVLFEAASELVHASKGKDTDAIGKAVEKVHTAYQKSEGACG